MFPLFSIRYEDNPVITNAPIVKAGESGACVGLGVGFVVGTVVIVVVGIVVGIVVTGGLLTVI